MRIINIVDIKKLVENIETSTPAEIYAVRRLIRKVYEQGNNRFLKEDKDGLLKLEESLEKMTFEGINKTNAIKFLKQDIKTVITAFTIN